MDMDFMVKHGFFFADICNPTQQSVECYVAQRNYHHGGFHAMLVYKMRLQDGV